MGTPQFISGQLTKVSSKAPETIVFDYLTAKQQTFKFKGDARLSFKVKDKQKDDLGFTYLRIQQVYKGTPVYGAELTAHVNSDGVLTALSGAPVANLDGKQDLKKAKKISKKKPYQRVKEIL